MKNFLQRYKTAKAARRKFFKFARLAHYFRDKTIHLYNGNTINGGAYYEQLKNKALDEFEENKFFWMKL